jgi:maltose alpha-D-glucosyltransferase / alpha-amylase
MNEESSFSSPLLKATSIEELLTNPALPDLQKSLIPYLPRQRWFGAKSRAIQTVRVTDWAKLPGLDAALVFLEVTHDDGSKSVYLVPLAISNGKEAMSIRARQPASIAASVMTPKGAGIVHDALSLEDARQGILKLIETNGEIHTQKGVIQGRCSSVFVTARGTGQLASRTASAEQSNTSILYGSKLILKLFRRLEPGENPDTEIGRFLTETAHFSGIAPFLGDITLRAGRGEGTTVAMLQGLVANDGDGWQVTLNELAGFYESVAALAAPKDLVEHAGAHLSAAGLLGERTAEMHLALATPTENPAFRAEPFTSKELSA